MLTFAAIYTWQDKFLVFFGLSCVIVVGFCIIYNILEGAYKRGAAEFKLPPPGPSPTRMAPSPPSKDTVIQRTPIAKGYCPTCGHRVH